MALGVLIIGKSGSGKSTSLRNFKKGEVGIISATNKPLPFRSDLDRTFSTDIRQICNLLVNPNIKAKSIVIDDAGYLITDKFMKGHAVTGKGNAVFELYNDLADSFYTLIRTIDDAPADKIVYMVMHEDKNDFGDVTVKTIGRLLSEKVDIPGLFTICLRCVVKDDGSHVFLTQSSSFDVAKSPMGMFDSKEIPNDLKAVDDAIREYYGMNSNDAENKDESEDIENA